MIDSNIILVIVLSLGICVGWILKQETSNLGRKITSKRFKRKKGRFDDSESIGSIPIKEY